MRLTLRDQLRTKVWVLCLLAAACSSDGSGGKGKGTTEDPSTGDGDKGDGDNGDGDNDSGQIPVPPVEDPISNDDDAGAPPASCMQGSTRECTCDDDKTKGEQYCIQGQFVGECTGCPCMDGQVQACVCDGVAVGSQLCVGTKYDPCECAGGGDGGTLAACPDGFSCQSVGGGMVGMGSVCVPAGGGAGPGGIPPMCQGNAECVTAGLPDATCSKIPVVGISLCVQACTPDAPVPDEPVMP